MAIKAKGLRIIQVEFKDTLYKFTVKHLGGPEMAALKARQAEIRALAAAKDNPENQAELQEMAKKADLGEIIADQSATHIIDVLMQEDATEEDKEGRWVPAMFEDAESNEVAWKGMTYEQRRREIEDSTYLFAAVWNEVAYSAASARILGK